MDSRTSLNGELEILNRGTPITRRPAQNGTGGIPAYGFHLDASRPERRSSSPCSHAVPDVVWILACRIMAVAPSTSNRRRVRSLCLEMPPPGHPRYAGRPRAGELSPDGARRESTMLVALVITFCPAGPSTRCVEMVATGGAPLTSIAECPLVAPDAASGWLAANPGWMMRASRCRFQGGGPARDA
jgi:hypothetical protein